jgi:hypothetical protein
MNIKITSKDGITLKTQGKYCTEDISINVGDEVGGSANGLPSEVATAEAMDALLVTENIGKVYKYTGATTETYTNGELYLVGEE